MTDNNDMINDILNQLDKEKAESDNNNTIPDDAPVKEADDQLSDTKDLGRNLAHEADISAANREKKPEGIAPVRRRVHEAPRPVNRAASDEAPEAPQFPARQRPPRPMHDEDIPMRNSAAVKRNTAHHKKKKKKRQRSRLPGVLILTVFIFALSICLSLVIIAFGKDVLGIGKDNSTKMIIIPDGATAEDVSQLLYTEGIINSPKCFQLFSKLRNDSDNYLAGEHFVSPNMAYETIIKTLTTYEDEEQKEPVTITFVEGTNIFEAADLLQENGVCNSAEFIYAFNAGGFGFDFEEELPKDHDPLKFADGRMEGYLFPDTYTFTVDMEPEQVCQKIYYNFNEKITSDDRIKKMKEVGLSLDKLITMASIVQREAPFREDMNHVAGVFWNRLEKPEAETAGFLQSDPTSNYSKYVIKPRLAVPNKEMVDAYDTYITKGLPPGPICNPGLDAIDAVLQKMKTDDFYFVANIYTRETFFTQTLEEHNIKDAEVKAAEAAYEAEQAILKEQEEANAAE
ncbi:MAG: endolytic transglycosylase MltG [Ruminococcus sp.]|uniref:endolytic transglycosylase MltG n=1 Tax=Ruminococcus sp. TaxID=41978 RepID=UPI0025D8B6BF|nr:endolytic transglycosylase MltG [Ruminococcus sp.]MBR5683747.1 endolytic transglycosylase MltG [Ruminococcus sp.]